MTTLCLKCNKPLVAGVPCSCNKPNVWLKAREKDDYKKLMKVYYAANYQKKKGKTEALEKAHLSKKASC